MGAKSTEWGEAKTVDDGETFPVHLGKQTLKLVCCDCMLTHLLGFSQKNGSRKIDVTVERDNRATAAYRREAKKRAKATLDGMVVVRLIVPEDEEIE